MNPHKTKKIRSFYTYPFIKRAIERRYGAVPFVEVNDILGAELVQSALESDKLTRLDAHLSERLFDMVAVPVFEPVFTRLFFAQMVAYVDGQRRVGCQIQDAIMSYLDYCGIGEDEIYLKTAKSMYDRYRYDKDEPYEVAKG